jgi:hypothetical protein
LGRRPRRARHYSRAPRLSRPQPRDSAGRPADLPGVLGFAAAAAAKLFGLFDRIRCAGWSRDMKPASSFIYSDAYVEPTCQ